MGEFTNAIKKGIENSKLAEKNTNEIGDILKDAEVQINSFLNREDISLFQYIDSKRILFSINVGNHKISIGNISLSNVGYPLKIEAFNYYVESCITGDELQIALCNVFSHVYFGDYLKRVQQLG